MSEIQGLRTQMSRRESLALLALAGTVVQPVAGRPAEKAYGPGATDTEIKIRQTAPYSGPASGFGVIGRSGQAYYNLVNDTGGVNGRRITLLSIDDAYTPPRTVEQVRRLVEQENVLGMFGMIGAAPNAARRNVI